MVPVNSVWSDSTYLAGQGRAVALACGPSARYTADWLTDAHQFSRGALNFVVKGFLAAQLATYLAQLAVGDELSGRSVLGSTLLADRFARFRNWLIPFKGSVVSLWPSW